MISAGVLTSSAALTNVPNVVPMDTLVAGALEKNSELKFYEAEIAAARASAKSAGRLASPELDATLGHKRASDRAIWP